MNYLDDLDIARKISWREHFPEMELENMTKDNIFVFYHLYILHLNQMEKQSLVVGFNLGTALKKLENGIN